MDISTYIKILTDTLIKKNNLLDELAKLNEEQENILISFQVNMESFDETLDKKEIIIEQLNQLDDGFEMIYDRVQSEIKENILKYRTEIILIQELIKKIMEKSMNIQMKEKCNKIKLETFLTKQKQEIKNYKVSSQTVSNYYKNMMNEYQGESYFLDKKK